MVVGYSDFYLLASRKLPFSKQLHIDYPFTSYVWKHSRHQQIEPEIRKVSVHRFWPSKTRQRILIYYHVHWKRRCIPEYLLLIKIRCKCAFLQKNDHVFVLNDICYDKTSVKETSKVGNCVVITWFVNITKEAKVQK